MKQAVWAVAGSIMILASAISSPVAARAEPIGLSILLFSGVSSFMEEKALRERRNRGEIGDPSNKDD